MTIEDMIVVITETGVNLDMDNFDADKTFEENNIDSLDIYTILLALEEKTGLSLEEVPLDKVNSAKTLLAYINANAA